MRSRALLSRNEEGVVLVLCLITLVVLTLIGVSTTTYKPIGSRNFWE